MFDLEYSKLQFAKFPQGKNVKSPSRANSLDAGIDFYIPDDMSEAELLVAPHDRILINSGIKVNVPPGWAMIAFNKSGIATKTGLQVGACVVDSGYQGIIHISLLNTTDQYVQLQPGAKIVQFVMLRIGSHQPEEVSHEDLFQSKSDRADGGFGSTDHK